ncbi:MAG: hypothetical protein COB69_05480 [Phycisphaera sp.]|nr:MAG: hypothetical protein COB69_05480 [Phycisphaera sp.]
MIHQNLSRPDDGAVLAVMRFYPVEWKLPPLGEFWGNTGLNFKMNVNEPLARARGHSMLRWAPLLTQVARYEVFNSRR